MASTSLFGARRAMLVACARRGVAGRALTRAAGTAQDSAQNTTRDTPPNRRDRLVKLECGRQMGVSEWGSTCPKAPVIVYCHGLPFNRMEPMIYVQLSSQVLRHIRLISIDR